MSYAVLRTSSKKFIDIRGDDIEISAHGDLCIRFRGEAVVAFPAGQWESCWTMMNEPVVEIRDGELHTRKPTESD